MTTTAAVYPEVASLLEALDLDAIALRKDREVRWSFWSTWSDGKQIRFEVDCRDLAFAPSSSRPNEYVRRAVLREVERIVGAAVDAEVQKLLDPSGTTTDV